MVALIQRITRGSGIAKQEAKQSRHLKKFWSLDEDAELQRIVSIEGTKWQVVAQHMPGRNASQCSQRWKRIRPNKEQQRTKWTKENDQLLLRLVAQYGCRWEEIAKEFDPVRTGRQIRERYVNQINPTIKKRVWTKKEDLYILEQYKVLGPKWAQIARALNGRSENQVKNRYNVHIRVKYQGQENPYYVVPQPVKKCDEDYSLKERKSTTEPIHDTQSGIDFEEIREPADDVALKIMPSNVSVSIFFLSEGDYRQTQPFELFD